MVFRASETRSVLRQRGEFCALPNRRSDFGFSEPSYQVTFFADTQRFIRPVAVHLAKKQAVDASVKTSRRNGRDEQEFAHVHRTAGHQDS